MLLGAVLLFAETNQIETLRVLDPIRFDSCDSFVPFVQRSAHSKAGVLPT